MNKKTLSKLLHEIAQLRLWSPIQALTRLLDESLSGLNADTVLLLLYNPIRDRWDRAFAAGEWYFPHIVKSSNVFMMAEPFNHSDQSFFISDIKKETLIDQSLLFESIKSSAVIPLRNEGEKLGVIFFNYRTPQKFTSKRKEVIHLLASEIAEILSGLPPMPFVEVQFILPDIIRTHITLPALLELAKYFDIAEQRLWTIEFIYSVFAVAASGNSQAIKELVALFRTNPYQDQEFREHFRKLLEWNHVEPLRLASMHYGSPASVDLLGIGKIIEVVRDTIKDLQWHGEYERKMAQLERQIKEEEITKIRLENERSTVDIVAQKLEILEKASSLKLSNNDKKALIAALLPTMDLLAGSPSTYLLKSRKARSHNRSQ